MSKKSRQYLSHLRWKRRYYRRRRFYPKGHNKRGPNFTPEEDQAILAHRQTDTALARMLHRSVESIQIRRSRLKKRKYRGIVW